MRRGMIVKIILTESERWEPSKLAGKRSKSAGSPFDPVTFIFMRYTPSDRQGKPKIFRPAHQRFSSALQGGAPKGAHRKRERKFETNDAWGATADYLAHRKRLHLNSESKSNRDLRDSPARSILPTTYACLKD